MKTKIITITLIVLIIMACNQSGNNTAEKDLELGNTPASQTDESLVAEYKAITMQAKGVLGKNLMNAISTKGTKDALSFCSEKAIFLTDSVASSLNVDIKRVSDKNRNPNNQANAEELEYILDVKESIANGQNIKPKLITSEGKHTAYFPILSNPMCLQCHGSIEQDIASDVSSKINELYPKDKAIGYESNELRGIWVIEKKLE